MNSSSWLSRLVETAVGLLIAALALSWAWRLLRTLLPLLLIIAAVMVIAPLALRRGRGW